MILILNYVSYSQLVIQRVKLEPNNISAYFQNTLIFDQNTTTGNFPAFEWPKGSNKFAVFTAGLTIAAMVNDTLKMEAASYRGECAPGYCVNGIPGTNSNFKFYKVSRGDNQNNNPDWLNWGLMVPYGAPFVDVNNNGTYEPAIDTPGVKNAASTIFICMTDGFAYSHTSGEGFGGGTSPLYAEVHLTAWAYTQPSYADMQFIKFVVINKGIQPWTRAYFSLVSDPDLGSATDDYIGCDTTRKLGYCYNGTNNDQVYGTAPPAVGFLLLKGTYSKYVNPPVLLNMTSFFNFHNSQVFCEDEPNGQPVGAYHYMQGYKKDSTCWLDPTQLVTPPNYFKKTKFAYPGDPETNIGWTEYKGSILNCSLDSSGTSQIPNPMGDRKSVLSSGAENLTVMPGDTQNIVICQLIARGTSNLNSVTKLKQLADVAKEFYNSGYVIGIKKISSEVPTKFKLEQNFPNPFNPSTKIRFEIPSEGKSKNSKVKIIIYDVLGKEIQTLVNGEMQPGTYEVTFDGSNYPSGVYFYQLKSGEFIETKKLILLK
jgi:hypothetical protein